MAASKNTEVDKLLEEIKQVKRGSQGKVWSPEQLMVLTVRKNLHLSQREFAKLLGVPVGTIRDWEQGRKQPDSAAVTLIKVAREFPEVLEHLAA